MTSYFAHRHLTTMFSTLQYPYPTVGSLPVLLLRLRLTLAGIQRKPTTLADIADKSKGDLDD
jgi:hypothetical protein